MRGPMARMLERRWAQALWGAAAKIDLGRELRVLTRAKQPREQTEIELWPEIGEKRHDFLDRCVEALTPCIGDKAEDTCWEKWEAAKKLGKKGFVTLALEGNLAIEPCGKNCLACQGADAPFDARAWSEADHPRGESGPGTTPGSFVAGGGGGGEGGKPKGGRGGGGKGKKGKVKSVDDFKKDKIEVNSNKTDKFIESWNDAIELDPGEFQQKFTGGLKSTMEISHRYYEHGDGDVMENEIRINGKLLNENDSIIGTYTRDIDLKNNKAESSYFAMNEDYQGKGEAKTMLAANVALYQELGLDEVKVHANIDVGGYAWAKYGYIPTEDSWDTLRGTLREKLDENRGGGGGGYTPDEWEAMSSSNQDAVFEDWKERSRDEFMESEIESWRESGEPLDQAKYDLARDFYGGDAGATAHAPEWAVKGMEEWREGRDESVIKIPFTNAQILAAVSVDYSKGREGRDDPEITFDDAVLDSLGADLVDPSFPSMEQTKPHELLTESMRNGIEAELIASFNKRAEVRRRRHGPAGLSRRQHRRIAERRVGQHERPREDALRGAPRLGRRNRGRQRRGASGRRSGQRTGRSVRPA